MNHLFVKMMKNISFVPKYVSKRMFSMILLKLDEYKDTKTQNRYLTTNLKIVFYNYIMFPYYDLI